MGFIFKASSMISFWTPTRLQSKLYLVALYGRYSFDFILISLNFYSSFCSSFIIFNLDPFFYYLPYLEVLLLTLFLYNISFFSTLLSFYFFLWSLLMNYLEVFWDMKWARGLLLLFILKGLLLALLCDSPFEVVFLLMRFFRSFFIEITSFPVFIYNSLLMAILVLLLDCPFSLLVLLEVSLLAYFVFYIFLVEGSLDIWGWSLMEYFLVGWLLWIREYFLPRGYCWGGYCRGRGYGSCVVKAVSDFLRCMELAVFNNNNLNLKK